MHYFIHAPPSHCTKPTHLKGAQHNILCDREITFTTFIIYALFYSCTAFSLHQAHPPQRSTTQHFVWSGNNIYNIYALFYLCTAYSSPNHYTHNIMQYLEATQNTAVYPMHTKTIFEVLWTQYKMARRIKQFKTTLHNFLAKHPYCKLLKSVNVSLSLALKRVWIGCFDISWLFITTVKRDSICNVIILCTRTKYMCWLSLIYVLTARIQSQKLVSVAT